MYVWPCLLSLFSSNPVTEATGDNHPAQQPLYQYSGWIAGLILLATLFVFSLVIVGSMIIYWLRIRRVHSKSAKGDGHTTMSNSSAEPFDPPATQPGTQGILNSQESDRQQFLKRSVCRILTQVCLLYSAWQIPLSRKPCSEISLLHDYTLLWPYKCVYKGIPHRL